MRLSERLGLCPSPQAVPSAAQGEPGLRLLPSPLSPAGPGSGQLTSTDERICQVFKDARSLGYDTMRGPFTRENPVSRCDDDCDWKSDGARRFE